MATEDFVMFPSELSAETCNELININLTSQFPCRVFRKNDVISGVNSQWMDVPTTYHDLFYGLMTRANESFGYSIDQLPYLQFNTYFPGSSMDVHIDVL